jgi:hypothetical protein
VISIIISPAYRLLRSGRILAKKSQAVDRQAVGCNLVVLKSTFRQANCKIRAPFCSLPYEQFKSALFLV